MNAKLYISNYYFSIYTVTPNALEVLRHNVSPYIYFFGIHPLHHIYKYAKISSISYALRTHLY